MTRQYCHVGTRTIAYLDSAPGDATLRPLVFLHAFPLGAGMWEPQLRVLCRDHRVITIDLRGFGGSTDPDSVGALSMDDYAADVIDLLAELSIPRAVFCACSMGGYAAFALWRAAPSLVRAFVLADTRPGADSSQGRANRRSMLALVDREGPSGVAREMIPVLIGKTTLASNPLVEQTVRHLIKQQSPVAIRGAILRMMHRADSTPILPTISVPTLVIVGEEDAITPVDEARRMAAAIPGATLFVVPEAGHLPNLERPDVFNDAVAGFLQSLPA